MLGLLEKLQYGLSGLVVLGSIFLYIWQPPEHRSLQLLPRSKITPRPAAAAPAPAAQPAPRSAAPVKPAVDAESQTILDRLAREQKVAGLAGKELQRLDCDVNRETYEYVTREANWYSEIQKAKSETLLGADGRETRLKLFDIDEESLIKQFGIENGDVIEFIDGELVDFRSSSVEQMQRWKRIQDKLGKRGKVALTITRAGQPIQLEFKVP